MAHKREFTIAELVEQSGVPATTIHHYRRLGLLPAPREVAPNRFLYDERHVESLRLVRLLRDRRHLSLPTIAGILPELLGSSDDPNRDEQAFRPAMWDQVVAAREATHGARRALLDAARKAFAGRGYADVNVADLCETVGIAKGSFYRHVPSKEALFLSACEAAVEDVRTAFIARVDRDGPFGSAELASAELARALAPELPLLLELVTRALQHQPDPGRTARALFAPLVATVREGTCGKLSPEAGRRAVQGALAVALDGALAERS